MVGVALGGGVEEGVAAGGVGEEWVFFAKAVLQFGAVLFAGTATGLEIGSVG